MMTSTRIRRTALTLLLSGWFVFVVSACSPAVLPPVAGNPTSLYLESTPENTPQPDLILSLPLVVGGPTKTPGPGDPTPTAPSATPTSFLPLPSDTPVAVGVRFAVIGDYGWGEQGAADVAALVKSWQPDFIITTGDNNYPIGSRETIDKNVGQFYQEYIHPYTGEYGPGAEVNRFFPSLGNHDWDSEQAQPYLDYFTLPGNERYYDFVWGPVHLFSLNGDSREPDGVGSSSDQAAWLQDRLVASTAPWQVVYTHQSPYSSGAHGSVLWMRWPFQEWGADVLLSGHDHSYERVILDGFPYIINGLGGGPIYGFKTPVEGSQVRYNEDYGAMLVEADELHVQFQFISRGGQVIDTFELVPP
ncbi:MAG TPA: metallophosphoesterase [Anaerolineales bacterium]